MLFPDVIVLTYGVHRLGLCCALYLCKVIEQIHLL